MSDRFEAVTIVKKANVYFGGNVTQSHHLVRRWHQ